MLATPDVVLLFASPSKAQSLVLQTLQEPCHPRLLLGCSSAGELSSQMQGADQSCAIAIHSDRMQFSVGIGHQIGIHGTKAAQELLAAFALAGADSPYQTALVLADVLVGQMDTILEYLSLQTRGLSQFIGGGGGDTAQIRWTPIFSGPHSMVDGVGLDGDVPIQMNGDFRSSTTQGTGRTLRPSLRLPVSAQEPSDRVISLHSQGTQVSIQDHQMHVPMCSLCS